MHSVRLPEPHTDAAEYAAALGAFLKNHAWLLDSHAVDFFVADYWSAVFPAEWRALKDEGVCTTQELLELATYGRVRPDWPASLREFVERTRAVALPRQPEDAWVSSMVADARPLDARIVYGMKPKKRIEVQSLSALIDRLARSHRIDSIVDMGAGQGYLDACLVYSYGHTVIGVDDDMIQTCGAKVKSDRIEQRMANQPRTGGRLFHVNRRVEPHESFAMVMQGLADASDNEAERCEIARVVAGRDGAGARWLLCGLHTCGDLAAAMIRQFLTGDASVLCGVGCCYNHVTEQYGDEGDPVAGSGYPLSHAVRALGVQLGFSARMVACQATCRWAEQPGASDNFTKHFWRALLQLVIVEHDLLPAASDTASIIVGRLGRGAFGHGFATYAEHALKRLGIAYPTATLTRSVLESYAERFASREKEIAVVWTLRSMLAEAIESLLLIDRYLHIVEADPRLEVRLVPVFDPVDSPRNMALIAIKPSRQ
ncbi:hypothetical protein HK105_200240 [Polyrhizophydium stewartii]|uniref:Methyltransferase domain-containing protein n=1 Tax=Polyrhizophydium stewartii TaxID=2732419 RepID=A0ABR4NL33_9FUNG